MLKKYNQSSSKYFKFSLHLYASKKSDNQKIEGKNNKLERWDIDEQHLAVSKFFDSIHIHIEVLCHLGHIHLKTFMELPECHYISKETLDKFKDNYPYEGEDDTEVTEVKIKYLIDQLPKIKRHMDEYYDNFKDQLGKQQFNKLYGTGQDTGAYLYQFIVIQNICQLIVGLESGGIWHISDLSNFDKLFTTFEVIVHKIHLLLALYISAFCIKQCYWLLKHDLRFIYKINQKIGFSSKLSYWETFQFYIIDTVFSHRLMQFYFFNFVWVFISLFCHVNFECMMLLSIIWIYTRMQGVLWSLLYNIKDLLTTFLMMCLCIFIFSNLTIYKSSIHDGTIPTDNILVPSLEYEGGDDLCANGIQCFWSLLVYGTEGGISQLGYNPPQQGFSEYLVFQKQLIDWLFFTLINVLLMNMVAGIIIDTFSELREKNNQKQEDYYKRCYICGLHRNLFEKVGLDFNYHIKEDHNYMNYAKFLIQLDNLDLKDCDALDLAIREKYKKEDISWFPIGKALSLERKKLKLKGEVHDDKKKKKRKKKKGNEQNLEKISNLQASVNELKQSQEQIKIDVNNLFKQQQKNHDIQVKEIKKGIQTVLAATQKGQRPNLQQSSFN